MKATDKISKIIGNLQDSIKELEGLKIAIPKPEEISSAEYTSAESSAEYSSAESSAEYTSAEYSSAEYTSAESSAESKPKVFFSWLDQILAKIQISLRGNSRKSDED